MIQFFTFREMKSINLFAIFLCAMILFDCKRSSTSNCLTSATYDGMQSKENALPNTVFGKGMLCIWKNNSINTIVDGVFDFRKQAQEKGGVVNEVVLDTLADQDSFSQNCNIPVHFALSKTPDGTYAVRVFANYLIDNVMIKSVRVDLVVSLPQVGEMLTGDELQMAEAAFAEGEESQNHVFHYDADKIHSAAFVTLGEEKAPKIEVLREKQDSGSYVYRSITGESNIVLKLQNLKNVRTEKFLSHFVTSLATDNFDNDHEAALAGNYIFFPNLVTHFYNKEKAKGNIWPYDSATFTGDEFPSDGLFVSFLENHVLDFELSSAPFAKVETAGITYAQDPLQENKTRATHVFDNLMRLEFRGDAALAQKLGSSENYTSISKDLEEKLMRNQILLNAIANNDHFVVLKNLREFNASENCLADELIMDFSESTIKQLCDRRDAVVGKFLADLQLYDIFGTLLTTPDAMIKHISAGLEGSTAYKVEFDGLAALNADLTKRYEAEDKKAAPLALPKVPSVLGSKLHIELSESDIIRGVTEEFEAALKNATNKDHKDFIDPKTLSEYVTETESPRDPVFTALYLRHKVLAKLASKNYLEIAKMLDPLNSSDQEIVSKQKRIPMFLETAFFGSKEASESRGVMSFPINMASSDDLQRLSMDAYLQDFLNPDLVQPQNEFVLNNQVSGHFVTPSENQTGELEARMLFQFASEKKDFNNFHVNGQATSILTLGGRYVLGFPLTFLKIVENGGATAIVQPYVPPTDIGGIVYTSNPPSETGGGGGAGEATGKPSIDSSGNTDTATSGPQPCKQ